MDELDKPDEQTDGVTHRVASAQQKRLHLVTGQINRQMDGQRDLLDGATRRVGSERPKRPRLVNR